MKDEKMAEEFDLHKLTIMLDKCEDDLKLALEYMEDHEKDFEKDWKKLGDYSLDSKFGAVSGFLTDVKIRGVFIESIVIVSPLYVLHYNIILSVFQQLFASGA